MVETSLLDSLYMIGKWTKWLDLLILWGIVPLVSIMRIIVSSSPVRMGIFWLNHPMGSLQELKSCVSIGRVIWRSKHHSKFFFTCGLLLETAFQPNISWKKRPYSPECLSLMPKRHGIFISFIVALSFCWGGVILGLICFQCFVGISSLLPISSPAIVSSV